LSTATSSERALRLHRREALFLGLAFVFLFFCALTLFLAPALRSGDFSQTAPRWGHLLVLPTWIGAAWLLHSSLGRVCPLRDPVLLPVAMLLTGWGQLVIWRITPAFGLRQTAWSILAVLAAWLVLRSPKDLRWLRSYRYLWLSAGLLLTGLTLVFGTNPSAPAPRLWLGCCGVFFQPSEPLRLLLIAFMASYLADQMAIQRVEGGAGWTSILAPLFLVWGISVTLLIAQRDLGTGSLFLVLFTTMLYLTSRKWQILLAAVILGVGVGWLAYGMFDIVQVRIEAWLNPWIDPSGGSYQIVQALIAVASGGIFGTGLGFGAPGYVPVAHSDLIFAAIAEAFGLAGGVGMIALFAVLVARGLRASVRQSDPFRAILAAGLATAFGLQSAFIIGGAIRFFPLAGITLPFVSYGGSSLLTSFIGLALLLIVSEKRGVDDVGLDFASAHIQFGLSLVWAALALIVGWWVLYRGSGLRARGDNPRAVEPAVETVFRLARDASSSGDQRFERETPSIPLLVHGGNPDPLTDESFTATMRMHG
jgi:cell division protein FtsW (lipid II flippase)